MKLKTFEDILDEINKLDCGYTTTDCVRDDVRQEAINHIKYKKRSEGFSLSPDVIYWIKYFFNITEEDLQ